MDVSKLKDYENTYRIPSLSEALALFTSAPTINTMSTVIPATRIPRKLWSYLQELMKKRMLSSKSELVKESLREYLMHHKSELTEKEFKIVESSVALREGREEDRKREKELFEWIEKILTRH